MKKYLVVASILVVLAAACAWYLLQKNDRPSIDEFQLAPRADKATGAEFLSAQSAAEHYREEIQKKPNAAKNYVELAQLFLQESRVTANHHFYIPKARALLDYALELEPGNFEATITKAFMLMTLHKFREAEDLAEKAIAVNPHNSFAYGVLCDAHVELGKYDEAVKACDAMMGVRPDLRSYARAAYLRELYGDIPGAIDALELAAAAGINGQEDRAWCLFQLGNLFFHDGKPDTAEYIFKGILEERPGYGFAMSGLAQIRNAQGKYNDAIELLSRAYQMTPEHIFLEQLADIYRATGQTRAAQGVEQIVLNAFDQHDRDGWNVDREYALFCADHALYLNEALSRAQREFERRPDNIDAIDTYTWTLLKAGRAAEAANFVGKALRLNTRNPILHYHAGMIYRAAGQPKLAREQLELALRTDSFINILYHNTAIEAYNSLTALALR